MISHFQHRCTFSRHPICSGPFVLLQHCGLYCNYPNRNFVFIYVLCKGHARIWIQICLYWLLTTALVFKLWLRGRVWRKRWIYIFPEASYMHVVVTISTEIRTGLAEFFFYSLLKKKQTCIQAYIFWRHVVINVLHIFYNSFKFG